MSPAKMENVSTFPASIGMNQEQGEEYAVVGGNMTITCVYSVEGYFDTMNIYDYAIKLSCPRCAEVNSTSEIEDSYWTSRITQKTHFSELRESDSGNYLCKLMYVNGSTTSVFFKRNISIENDNLPVIDEDAAHIENGSSVVYTPRYKLTLNQSDDHPYVGGSLTVNCTFYIDGKLDVANISDFELVLTCPRCKPQNGVEFYFAENYSKQILYKSVRIAPLDLHDSGEYRCVPRLVDGLLLENMANTLDVNVTTMDIRTTPFTMYHPLMLLLYALAICLLVACIVFCIYYRKQRIANRILHLKLENIKSELEMRPEEKKTIDPNETKLSLDNRVKDLSYDYCYEIDKNQLTVFPAEKLGRGAFGEVVKGWLVSESEGESKKLPVAVKQVISKVDAAQFEMLSDELKILANIGQHPNVLCLVGAVTQDIEKGQFYVVLELCKSNLKDFLMKKDKFEFINELVTPKTIDNGYIVPNQLSYAAENSKEWAEEMAMAKRCEDSNIVSTSDLLSFSTQIANGMKYLASVPCIHRDLAARNVLLTKNRTCRIADFGMARDQTQYYRVVDGKNFMIDPRRAAPEAIEAHLFTVQSDVWSFGVVLFEIFSLGAEPYNRLKPLEVLDAVRHGERIKKPLYVHDEIYRLMGDCWKLEPNERPSFDNCYDLLVEHLKRACPDAQKQLEKELLGEDKYQKSLKNWLQSKDDLEKPRNRAYSTENEYIELAPT